MSSRLATMLEMLTVTKAHGLEQTEISAVNSSISGVANAGKKVDLTGARFGSWAWCLNTFLSAACMVFCAVLAVRGKISVGDIVLYQTMFVSLSGYVSTLVNVLPTLGSGFDALSSVSGIMSVKDVEMNIGKRSVPSISGDVEFKNVCYKYPGSEEYIIKNLSLKVKAGECIAVVGASGSGKSTIMNLVIGFLTPFRAACLSTENRYPNAIFPNTVIISPWCRRTAFCFPVRYAIISPTGFPATPKRNFPGRWNSPISPRS